MRIHIKYETIVIIRHQTTPYSLQAGRVGGRGVCRGHPGNGLSSSRMRGVGKLVDNVLNLVSFFKRSGRIRIAYILDRTISKNSFMISISPFSGGRVNPVVVNAVYHLLPIRLKLLRSAGKIFMNPRL